MQIHHPKNRFPDSPVRQTQRNNRADVVTQRVAPLEGEMRQGEIATAFGVEQTRLDVPAIQRQANNSGLPDNLKSGIENLSGYSMDDVKVHYNSDQPAQLNAHAYAQGTDIHIAPGQEGHLPHEAWHVVQQKQGRVRPTMQLKGKVNINDNVGLEQEADVMGFRAQKFAPSTSKKTTSQLIDHKPLNTTSPVQRMAVSRIKDYEQGGGTCGLYSLGMAISGVDPRVVRRRNQLLHVLLRFANRRGTLVGEFMDANNLAQVGRDIGMTANVINFNNPAEFTNRLDGTGTDGVIMGYSVFEAENAATQRALAGFEHLFSHWSVIEGKTPTHLSVRDPNAPGNTRPVSIAKFYRQNQQTNNPGGFSFQEFETHIGSKPGEASVNELRGDWERTELRDRAGGATALSPYDAAHLPVQPLNLKGKIVSVSGQATDPGFTTGAANLRGADKKVVKALPVGTALLILNRKKDGRFFKDPDKSWHKTVARFHYWVRTEEGDTGWVRSSAISG